MPTRAGVGLSLRTVRTKTHKLTIDLQSMAGELYDMIGDPDETTNLFNSPEHADLQHELLEFIASRPDDAGPMSTQVGMA